MKMQPYKIILLFLFTTALAACGGGSDKTPQVVEITSATRCTYSVGVGEPNNCMPEKIEGGSYITDQNTIHLIGISSATEDDGCPEPTIFGPPCIPSFPFNYSVGWINSSNDANGRGDVAFTGRFLINDPVRWSTYNFFNVSIGKGIPWKWDRILYG